MGDSGVKSTLRLIHERRIGHELPHYIHHNPAGYGRCSSRPRRRTDGHGSSHHDSSRHAPTLQHRRRGIRMPVARQCPDLRRASARYLRAVRRLWHGSRSWSGLIGRRRRQSATGLTRQPSDSSACSAIGRLRARGGCARAAPAPASLARNHVSRAAASGSPKPTAPHTIQPTPSTASTTAAGSTAWTTTRTI